MKSKANNTTNEYLKTKVMTASQEQLQLMLYDGAIRFCEQARQAVLDKEIEKSFNLLTRAEAIIMEMVSSLRDDFAPETCAKMRSLYFFCYEKFVAANMKKDVVPLDEGLRVLRHMRETWVMLMEQLKREKTGRPGEPELSPLPPDMDISQGVGINENPFDQPVGSNISLEG